MTTVNLKKTTAFIIILVLTFTVARGQFTKIGGGLAYGTGFHFKNETAGVAGDLLRSPLIGIYISGIYDLKPPFRIAPSFSYFIPRTNRTSQPVGGENTRISSVMFDINGHYVFNPEERFEFYGLGGLDITFAGIRWSGPSTSVNDNAIGLNLGAGTGIKLIGNLDLKVEVKYILSKYSQFLLNAGVFLNLQPAGKKKS